LKGAQDFFNRLEGLPYGYHNFLYSWIDTERDNFPEPLDLDFVISAFSLMEHFFPAVIRNFLIESFEKRLGV